MQSAIISVWSGVWIEDTIRPASAQLFEREIAPAAHVERLDNGLGSPSKPDRLSICWAIVFVAQKIRQFVRSSHEFAAQLWGSMVVTYKIGQELTQAMILQRLKAGCGDFSFSSGRAAFLPYRFAAQLSRFLMRGADARFFAESRRGNSDARLVASHRLRWTNHCSVPEWPQRRLFSAAISPTILSI